MKRLILTLGLMIGLSTVTFAQDAGSLVTVSTNIGKSDHANIKVDGSTTYNYGSIRQGDNGEYSFKCKNGGKQPLMFKSAVANCSCLVTEYPKEPIAPGKAFYIKVKYDTMSIGLFYKTTTIASNSKNGDLVLTVKGNVLPKMTPQG